MKKILGVVAVMFLLVGCGGKATTTVCKGNVSGFETSNEISASGDKVTKTKEIMTMDLSAANPTDEEIEEFADMMGEKFNGIKGLTFDHEVKDKKLIVTVVTDYEKADLDQLVKEKIVEVKKEGSTKFISLKVSLESAEKQGLTCKEK